MRQLLAGRGWWIALAVLVAAIVFGSLRGGEEGRAPARDSLDQGREGFAAWSELLRGAGGEVDELGTPPSGGGLDPADTVIALDIGDPTEADVEALREFVAGGGYLIAGGGTDPDAIAEITGLEPETGGSRSGLAGAAAPGRADRGRRRGRLRRRRPVLGSRAPACRCSARAPAI